jgi:hypothetical protein
MASRKHGEKNMVSRDFGNLSDDDLRLLEEIVAKEFASAKSNQSPNSARLLRIYNALRSQRNLLTMPKW